MDVFEINPKDVFFKDFEHSRKKKIHFTGEQDDFTMKKRGKDPSRAMRQGLLRTLRHSVLIVLNQTAI